MPTYIGTATSRVDGHAKVTGAAKYAGERVVFGRPIGAYQARHVAGEMLPLAGPPNLCL